MRAQHEEGSLRSVFTTRSPHYQHIYLLPHTHTLAADEQSHRGSCKRESGLCLPPVRPSTLRPRLDRASCEGLLVPAHHLTRSNRGGMGVDDPALLWKVAAEHATSDLLFFSIMPRAHVHSPISVLYELRHIGTWITPISEELSVLTERKGLVS